MNNSFVEMELEVKSHLDESNHGYYIIIMNLAGP